MAESDAEDQRCGLQPCASMVKRPIPMSVAACCLARRSTASTRWRLAVRAGNTRTDSAHNRYHIAPQELVSIQRQARERSLDIVGFYHSHPDHPAHWSATDFKEAHWLGCSYVITSVEKGVAKQTNSFFLAGTGRGQAV